MKSKLKRNVFGFRVLVYDTLFKREETVTRCQYPTKRAFIKAMKGLHLVPIGEVETLYSYLESEI